MKFLFCFLFFDLVLGFYHRQGRFVDFSINQYATQLPSIHDITSSIIHYRVPIAVFVPSVRFHFRNDRKKNFYVSPSANKKSSGFVPSKSFTPIVSPISPENYSDEEQTKIKNIEPQNSNTLISRSGWTAKQQARLKSLSQPAFLLPIRYPTNRLNYPLNYASQSPMESNIDLIPFLYKDNLARSSYKKLSNSKLQPKQPISNQDNNYFVNNLPFSTTQPLENKKIFNSNFDILQPNSLVMAPIQTSPLLSSILPNSVLSNPQQNNTEYNSTMSFDVEKQKNHQLPNSVSSTNITSVEPMPEQFDISQVSDNTFDGLQENVQNLEPIDANVPINLSIENLSNLNNNASSLIDSDNKILDNKKNFSINFNQAKPANNKNNISSNRVLRSLSLDTPSVAPLFAAAVSQSGHRIQHPSAFINKLLYGESF